MKRRSISEINAKIERGEAAILTAKELCDAVRNGEKIKFEDVDVVTGASCALMSGSSAILSFPVCERDVFIRAEKVFLNGIPAFPGPAPNERLGEIDAIVYATAVSKYDKRYGGGHLLRDIVAKKEISVEVETIEGKKIETEVSIEEMTHARFLGIRNLFKNYMAFVNKKARSAKTIFHVKALKGRLKEASVCGAGEINPLEKDPTLKTIGVGTRIIINGAIGYVTGLGTRATIEKPCLSGIADMHGMNPYYMGGFITSYAPETIVTWGMAIAIIDEEILKTAMRTDDDIALPIADINDRIPFTASTYARAWSNVDLEVSFDKSKCKTCKSCRVEKLCPTNAFSFSRKKINKNLCFDCGACVKLCKHRAFSANLGTINFDGVEIPITIRQTSRKKAEKMSEELKKMVENKEFYLTEKIEKLEFSEKDNIPCRFCNRDFCAGKRNAGEHIAGHAL